VIVQELPELKELRAKLGPKLREGYEDLLKSKDPIQALVSLRKFQVLCAVRRGPFGVEGINRLTEEVLLEAGFVERRNSTTDPWFHGRTILVTTNDARLELFNGDVGIALRDPDSGKLQACFPGAQPGQTRRFAPVRLPLVETAYALTIHKSQGSEFENVLVVLPDRISPLLTRELLYTAITRAKKSVQVWGPRDVIRKAIGAVVERVSGLREALEAGLPHPPINWVCSRNCG
jgi:exodeoxyribonuclease V alpha subunit